MSRARFLFDTSVPNWHYDADCRDHDPELWFADGTGKATAYKDLLYAKSICDACPVRQLCLDDVMRQEGGIAAEGRHGIRAGLTPDERYQQHRRNNRKKAAA
ncbi:WhiB family transcriptional regulator [Kitasatospora sp. NBC_01287]|uniref:WhiB family transcriptional regulator n=1 Tax=Kitasatospora sp. NBC_01287 TaxID=2903573 RepID=UPI0022575CB9|nr:WhiB family transcriptional regulator [Kitasatospora sp. NBC_01287]MCX4751722.1 WhiB family transcriptional regulator [Kitasatospora sp. NBC_01287]MCX4751986.1 WhiB family transcriptional regulator [Kitasatospora sp. NBC_01287]